MDQQMIVETLQKSRFHKLRSRKDVKAEAFGISGGNFTVFREGYR